MTNINQPSSDPADLRQHHALRLAVIMIIAVVPTIGVYAVLAFRSGAWQMFVAAGAVSAYFVGLLVSVWLIRRGHIVAGLHLIIHGLAIGFLTFTLVIAGFGALLGAVTVLVALALAGQTMPARAARTTIIVSIVLGVLNLLLDMVLPAYRLEVPELQTFVPVVLGALILVYGYLVVRQFNSYTLRTKMLSAFLSVSLLSVASVAFYTDRTIRATLSSEVAAKLKSVAESQATAVGDLISTVVDEMRSFSLNQVLQDSVADANTSYQGSPSDIQAGIDQLDQQWRAADQANDDTLPLIRSKLDNLSALELQKFRSEFPDNVEVFITDRYGAVVAATNRTSDYNQADEAWWQAAYNNGHGAIYVGQPEFDESSATYAANFAVPLYIQSTHEVIGVLRSTLRMTALVNLLALTQSERAGSPDLLLPNGEFLQAGGSIPAPSDLVTQLPAATSSDSIEVMLDGSPNLASVAPVTTINREDAPAITSLNWTILTHQPRAEALAPAEEQARNLLLFAGLIAGIMAVAAIGGSRLLINPIARLTQAAEKVKHGDLTVQATVESKDEIGELATTFNDMTTQLRGMVGTLEERVQARTAQLRASAEVGRAASSILEAGQLMREVVTLITDRFGFYYAAVFTLDAVNEFAVLREATGEAGRILKERGHKLAVDNKSMVGATILTRRARIALDVGKEAIRFANPLLPNTRSEIALPLLAGDRVLGTLDVQSERAGAFDEASAEVLQTMADQVAVALQNAELFDRSEQQARTLTVLNQMSRDLAQATTLDHIARITARTVTQLVGTSHTILAFKTAHPELLSVHRVFDDRDPSLDEAQMMPMASTLVGHVLQTGQPFHATNLVDYAAQYQDAAMLPRIGMQSMVSMPLRAGDHILGALNVGRSQSTTLTGDQVAQLEQVASQMAVTLENFNLVEQTRQALSELDAANRRLIGQAWEKYSQTTGDISAEWHHGAWIKDEDGKRQAEDRGLIANRQPSDSNLQLPIKVRGQTIGEFNIMTGGAQHDWTSDDIAFARSLIDQVGQMIENARLLEETERFAHREQRIREITTRIRAAGDIQGVLEATAVELARSMGVPRAIVRLTTSEGVKPEI